MSLPWNGGEWGESATDTPIRMSGIPAQREEGGRTEVDWGLLPVPSWGGLCAKACLPTRGLHVSTHQHFSSDQDQQQKGFNYLEILAMADPLLSRY